jgi:tRNA dimethylallyltransferase
VSLRGDTEVMAGKEIIALFGPTGVGKTAVAIAVADALRARGEQPVAISADALQVYEGLEVLTGAATPAEQAHLEHRLLSFVPVGESFSAGRFAELAHGEIDSLLAAGARPIVVGGTGLYLRAALAELALQPPPAPGVRERLTAQLAERGVEAMYAELEGSDPAAAASIKATDRQRIIRALENLEGNGRAPEGLILAGQPVSGAPAISQLWTNATRHPTLLVALTMRREQLYAQIDARVDAMVAGGAIEEVARAQALGAGTTARKALGFDELLRGDVEAMKLRTRRYARRQLTWMRKLPDVLTIDLSERSAVETAAAIVASLTDDEV